MDRWKHLKPVTNQIDQGGVGDKTKNETGNKALNYNTTSLLQRERLAQQHPRDRQKTEELHLICHSLSPWKGGSLAAEASDKQQTG
jgi:hypothetical protein